MVSRRRRSNAERPRIDPAPLRYPGRVNCLYDWRGGESRRSRAWRRLSAVRKNSWRKCRLRRRPARARRLGVSTTIARHPNDFNGERLADVVRRTGVRTPTRAGSRAYARHYMYTHIQRTHTRSQLSPLKRNTQIYITTLLKTRYKSITYNWHCYCDVHQGSIQISTDNRNNLSSYRKKR